MAFPTTGLLDNFNRASLGSNWTADIHDDGEASLIISSNQVTSPSSDAANDWYNVDTYGPDCEVYADMSVLPDVEMYLCLRMVSPGTSGVDFYAIVFAIDVTHDFLMYRCDNASWTQLGSTVTQTCSNGDGIGFEAEDDTLTVHRRSSGSWSSLMTRTDSTYNSAGYLALSDQGENGRIDNFSGGTIVTSVFNSIIMRTYRNMRQA